MNMMSKELLIQLPDHERYHVFQTKWNVLNFIRDDITKNIVQFHEDLSKAGYNHIPSSSLKFSRNSASLSIDITEAPVWEKLYFKQGTQIGNKVLIYESNYVSGHNIHQGPIENRNTMVWFTKRKQWRMGPELPIKFSELCSAPLNSTSVFMTFIGENEEHSQGYICIRSCLSHGHHEGGHLGLAKKFKTPFFKR